MATAIYISELGQSANKESVEKYAARYIKELEYSTTGTTYYTKVDKVYYNEDQSSLAVRIYAHSKKDNTSTSDTLIYTFYDFEYNDLLNQKFLKKSFLTLKHISMHKSYWDDSKSGQSCTRLIFNKMNELEYWNN